MSNAKDRLSSFFDYAVNDCKIKSDWITVLFINTGYAEQFERGNPAFVAGMSGVELARAVILKAYGRRNFRSLQTLRNALPSIGHGGHLQNNRASKSETFRCMSSGSTTLIKRRREHSISYPVFSVAISKTCLKIL